MKCSLFHSNSQPTIVELGITDTTMARRIGDQASDSPYRQRARFTSLFTASLKNPAPTLFGRAERFWKSLRAVSWQLRHPVGPDAAPFLQWRRQMTDEEWVDLNASDDETWYRSLERDFGLDTRPKK